MEISPKKKRCILASDHFQSIHYHHILWFSWILIASLNYLIALCQIKKEKSLYTVKTDHILSVCIVGENIYNNTCTLFAKISLWNKGWGDKSYWYLLIGWWLMFLNCLSCAMSACNFWFFLFWIAKCSFLSDPQGWILRTSAHICW